MTLTNPKCVFVCMMKIAENLKPFTFGSIFSAGTATCELKGISQLSLLSYKSLSLSLTLHVWLTLENSESMPVVCQHITQMGTLPKKGKLII